ncbi:MAG: hypothetical protein HFH46_01305 [Bacilli bacterium]|nr:hypothetical protein [Bacilli bacterium]
MKDYSNISPKLYTLSAAIVGFLLIDDSNANEQNALGNWLMLVAQVLCTNAYFLQLQTQSNQNTQPTNEETIIMMQKMINALTKEVNELKKQI